MSLYFAKCCEIAPCRSKVSLSSCLKCHRNICGRHCRPVDDANCMLARPSFDWFDEKVIAPGVGHSNTSTICTLCIISAGQSVGFTMPTVMMWKNTSRCPPWISAFAVIGFDLGIGQVVEFLYPPLPFSSEQEHEIAFRAFPDTNTKQEECVKHAFSFHCVRNLCDFDRQSCYRTKEDSSKKRIHDPAHPRRFVDLSCDSTEEAEFFGMSLFFQRPDASIKRGAYQKAIVVLTTWPFPHLCSSLLDVLYQQSFAADGPCMNLDDLIVALYTQIEKSWPFGPLPSTSYDLPCLSSEISFNTPYYSTLSNPLRMLHWNVQSTRPDTLAEVEDSQNEIVLPMTNSTQIIIDEYQPKESVDPDIMSARSSFTPVVQEDDSDLVAANSECYSPRSHGGQPADTGVLKVALTDVLKYCKENGEDVQVDDFVLFIQTITTLQPSIGFHLASRYDWDLYEGIFTSQMDPNKMQEILVYLQQELDYLEDPSSPRPQRKLNRAKMSLANLFSDPLSGFELDLPGSPRATSRKAHFLNNLRRLVQTAESINEETDVALQEDQSGVVKGSALHSVTNPNPYQDLCIHSALYQNIGRLWKLWEIMIRGEPLGVLGPETSQVSCAVLTLCSLIAPLCYGGIVRPFVTINSKELDTVYGRYPQAATVLGVCNPFFVRHFSQWNHFLVFAATDGKAITNAKEAAHNKTIPANHEKRDLCQVTLINALFSDTHFTVKTDMTLVSGIAKWDRIPQLTNSSKNIQFPTSILREHFSTLTNDFLRPLVEAIRDICYREQPYFLPCVKRSSYLQKEVFMAYLNMYDVFSNPAVTRRHFKSGREHSLYDRFLETVTFDLWMEEQVHRHFRTFLITCQTPKALPNMCPSLEKFYEQWNSLLDIELKRSTVDIELINAMCRISRDLIALNGSDWDGSEPRCD